MVLYKTFRTAKNYYLYDTSTNKVVNLYKKAYNYINNAKKGNEFKLEEKSIKEYDFFKSLMEREGILSNVEYKYRFPYDKEELVYIYKNNVQNIILELTNSCNMRCKYCTFNNCYQDSPSYSSDRMSLDAKPMMKRKIPTPSAERTIRWSLNPDVHHKSPCTDMDRPIKLLTAVFRTAQCFVRGCSAPKPTFRPFGSSSRRTQKSKTTNFSRRFAAATGQCRHRTEAGK